MSLEVTCPDNCSSRVPKPKFSDCAGEFNDAQITDLLIGNPGYPLNDWTDPVEWAGRISNTNNAANAIRHLSVIGEKPAPEATEKEVSHKRTIKQLKSHTINFDIDETNDVNSEMVREYECGGTKQLWYITSSGHLYGGNVGVPASIQLDEVISKSLEDLILIVGTAKWKSRFSPERIVSPVVTAQA